MSSHSRSLGRRCVRGPLLWVAVWLLAAVSNVAVSTAHAQSVEFEDWAGFKPGTWCVLETITKTLNEQGQPVSTSVTRARYRVIAFTGDAVHLVVENQIVELDGKQITRPDAKLIVRQYGRTESDKVELVEQPKENLDIGMERVECRNVKAVLTGSGGSREIVTSFRDAAVMAPVRRVVRTFDSKGESIDTTTTDAWAVNVPHRVGEELLPTTHYRTLYRNHKLSSTAVTIKSANVPGQVVQATIAERDASNRLLRQTVQEMKAYGGPEKPVRATMTSVRPDRPKDRHERREERREHRRGWR